MNNSKLIAYFSPEFALEENIPIYAGGLGVLAGDHLRSANQADLNLVAIGLFYKNGYFKQKITKNGTQLAEYYNLIPEKLNLTQLTDYNLNKIILSIDFPDGKLFYQTFIYKIGNIHLYLLDTNLDENLPQYRNITDKLYGGDREHRLQQEILLGIGGVKLLNYIGLNPDFIHINEGHAAFALLEWQITYAQNNHISYYDALNILRNQALFTTHTPVIHGNEVFLNELIVKYFNIILENSNLTIDEFIKFGNVESSKENSDESHSLIAKNSMAEEEFSMTILAFKLCNNFNAVSKLHCVTSRNLWKSAFDVDNSNDVPINYITNGVDLNYWLADETKDLIEQYIGNNHFEYNNNESIIDAFHQISDDKLILLRNILRNKLINFIRNSYKIDKPDFIKRDKFKSIDELLSENILTIGFSRRFAQYKRADLLFYDIERLKKILFNSDTPVQFIFSGKAHPLDVEGKDMLKRVIKSITENHLEKRIVFLENYDLKVAKYIVQGCDIWLNNPIKPLEASGTSGMKSALNGGINVSIDDGWWAEAYNVKNGFVFNDDISETQASENLYNILENEVIPMYYNNQSQWLEIIKQSMFTAITKFSSLRMVFEYNEMYYE